MSDAWNPSGRCRDLAEECRHVPATCSSIEKRNHHLRMESITAGRGVGCSTSHARRLAARLISLDRGT